MLVGIAVIQIRAIVTIDSVYLNICEKRKLGDNYMVIIKAAEFNEEEDTCNWDCGCDADYCNSDGSCVCACDD